MMIMIVLLTSPHIVVRCMQGVELQRPNTRHWEIILTPYSSSFPLLPLPHPYLTRLFARYWKGCTQLVTLGSRDSLAQQKRSFSIRDAYWRTCVSDFASGFSAHQGHVRA